LATFHTASAKLNLNSPTNMAIYWGMLCPIFALPRFLTK
jgi:hypothetical protein